MGCACKSKQAKHGLLYNYTYVVLPWTKKRLHGVVVCFQPPCHGRGLEAERKRQIKLTPRSVYLSTTWRRLGRDDGFNKPKKITAFSNAMEEVHREAKKTNQTKHNLDITNKLGISASLSCHGSMLEERPYPKTISQQLIKPCMDRSSHAIEEAWRERTGPENKTQTRLHEQQVNKQSTLREMENPK